MVNKKAVCVELAREAGLSTERFPKTHQEVAKAEDALAKELEKMSLDEQEKALFDVHGISHVEVEEDPQMVQESLNKLELAIEGIEKKDAYNEAKFLNESYVTSKDFRMLFLRGEDFDIEVAAQTIVYHFELKKELFGNGEILAREVMQSDLEPADRYIVESGIYQLCSERDASGRTIQIINCDGPDEMDTKPTLRACWYLIMASLREEEVQKRGIVWICFSYTEYSMDLEFYRKYNRVDVAIPVRTAAGHYCYQSDIHDPLAVGFQIFAHKHERSRTKIHKGTHEEIVFELQTYGIPAEKIPVNTDGTWGWRFHSEWLQALRAQEEKYTPILSNVLIPKKCDVLFGKNARARDHVGNMRAHQLVEEYFEEYEEANKFQKTDIANRIIGQIQESDGRFLKQDELGTWTVVPDTVARQKIAHWYRHLRHKKSKQPPKPLQETPPLNSKRDSTGAPMGTFEDSTPAAKRVTPCPSPIDPTHGNPTSDTEEVN